MDIEYFQVTQEYIDLGTRAANSCPIALALKTKYDEPHVYNDETMIVDRVYIEQGSDPPTFKHSPGVSNWINDFDNDKPVKPIIIAISHKLQIISLA